VERIIKEYIKPKHNIDVNTVCKYYASSNKKKSRPVLIYSLREEQRVKTTTMHWEE